MRRAIKLKSSIIRAPERTQVLSPEEEALMRTLAALRGLTDYQQKRVIAAAGSFLYLKVQFG